MTLDGANGNGWSCRAEFWAAHVPDRRPRRLPRRARQPLILSGHGMSLRIRHGALEVRNGFTHYPQTREEWRFFTGDWRQPSRIVVIDGDGSLTFDVLAWLATHGIPLIRLDWRGQTELIAGSAYAAEPELVASQRRMQADPKRRMAFNRWLITEKFARSASTMLAVIPDGDATNAALAELTRSTRELKSRLPVTVNDLRGIEGRAALAYFRAWRSIPLRWKGTSRRPIPVDWYHVVARMRPNRSINRRATHPMNAILNYGYAVLQSQVQIALAAAGFDPTIGLMHTERPERPAFVLDLMEPLRPMIDATAINFVRVNTFEPQDFTLDTDGTCRLHPALARRVVTEIDTCSGIGAFLDALQRRFSGLRPNAKASHHL